MIKNIITLIFLFLFMSCSKAQVKEDQLQKVIINDDWSLINKIESEKWNKKILISNLGTPNEVIEDKKQASDLFVYDYPQVDHQKWGFEVSKDGKIVSITFIPNASTRESFTIEKIIQKWGTSCVKKKEVDSSQHFIRNIYYLECEKNRRAYLNKYDEVTSLAINIL